MNSLSYTLQGYCRIDVLKVKRITSRTEYSMQTPKKSTLFSGQYLRNHWNLDIGVLGYIGIVWPKEHSPGVRSFPPGTPCIYRVSQEECARLREGVPYVKVYLYNPKHLCPKLNGYGDNGQRKVWLSCGSTHCTRQLSILSISVLECGIICQEFTCCFVSGW